MLTARRRRHYQMVNPMTQIETTNVGPESMSKSVNHSDQHKPTDLETCAVIPSGSNSTGRLLSLRPCPGVIGRWGLFSHPEAFPIEPLPDWQGRVIMPHRSVKSSASPQQLITLWLFLCLLLENECLFETNISTRLLVLCFQFPNQVLIVGPQCLVHRGADMNLCYANVVLLACFN